VTVTRSWEQEVAAKLGAGEIPVPAERRRELWWLLAASLMIASSLSIVFLAKTQNFGELGARLDRGELLNLNTVTEEDQLLAFLQVFPDQNERRLVADQLWTYLGTHRPLPNVGSLARIRVSQSEIESDLRWGVLKTQLTSQLKRQSRPASGEIRLPLLPMTRLKNLMVVRTPQDFFRKYAVWMGIYFAAFYVVHLAWRYRRFRGDAAILPALHLLTGIGLTLAVSLRDPLRDTLEFEKFAWGAAAGCCLLLLPLLRVFNYRNFERWIYTPLLASFALFALLMRFGSGPTGSDSKVNLGPFQPVEIIKLLLVLFIAGYLTAKWESLRDLREKRLMPGWLDLPRFAQVLPVMCAVGIALVFFFLLKDLGPALVTGFLFLVMFGIARGRWGLAVFGIALLVGGVATGYHIGNPPTVVDRISMWLAPWDNNVRGGDQLAHSLWALATGGLWGSGPGWGDPGMIPAGHTDLVLPAIGEEWGFAGVLSIAVLFVFLVHRAFRIAMNAAHDYGIFLALGLGTLIAIEMLLISAGVLGAIPLSGVVSPFLSSGNTAMLSNFLIFAMLVGISNQGPDATISRPFAAPVRVAAWVLALCALALVGKAAYFQVLHDGEYLALDARVFEEDGVKRAQHNPRLNSLARELTRGNVYDRNGVLLATSRFDELERHRAEYEKFGVALDRVCSRLDSRHYPFGPATVHLLGDLRTGERFHASNASLIEHDSNSRLQGFSDYRELASFVRYRHQPGNPAMEQLRARDRSVRASIDIRLQLRATDILRHRLEAAHKDKGALVILNSQTGDVLAMVSAPLPTGNSETAADDLLDRARYGQYPPGSTFKLVTAIAALRADPKLQQKSFHCQPLGDGRVGTRIAGWNRPIRDDVGDSAHGALTMMRAITVSCNAYFAQLGVYSVGAQKLHDTAELLDIPAGDVKEIKSMMPFAAYGQGPVLITPFKMARVSATIAAGGSMPQGRWVIDESNERRDAPRAILPAESALLLASAMRSVVISGTGRRAMSGTDVSVAGKTGTAQMDEGMPHSWFTGFAPYDGVAGTRIAFAVVVEHGGYGGTLAAPIARELVEAARDLGIISASRKE
jgi:cell division protein FtsW (lipid II flippase)/cell division protein FtsI/penicillin-binding protein 2